MFWTLHLIGWLSFRCLVVFFYGALICSFIWAFFFWSQQACYIVRGRALGICQGRETHIAALWHCLWGWGLSGNNAAPLLCSSALSNGLSWETGSFSHLSNPHHSPLSALSLSFAFSQTHPHSPTAVFPSWTGPWHRFLLVWLFWLTFSLISLLEFHQVWFSGNSGCLLILDWLFFSFWLCKDVKGFCLCLHLGRNSDSSLISLLV